MGTGFRRRAQRAGVACLVLTASAALALPGTANAAEPVVVGSCDATLKGEDGQPLTVDLGAAVNDPQVLDVGLGSDSGALLSLPVKDALDNLGLSEDNLVVDEAGRICDTTQDTVNTVARPVQRVAPENGVLPNPPDDEDPGVPSPDDPNNPDNPDDPGTPGDGGDNGDAPGDGTPGGGAPTQPTNPGASGPQGTTPAATGAVVPVGNVSTLAPIDIPPAASIPPVAPPVAPDLGQPDAGQDKRPDVTAKNSGTAEALPSANAPDRLPLLLAVIALALVIAALARTWLRRKAA